MAYPEVSVKVVSATAFIRLPDTTVPGVVKLVPPVFCRVAVREVAAGAANWTLCLILVYRMIDPCGIAKFCVLGGLAVAGVWTALPPGSAWIWMVWVRPAVVKS